jgi:expansin (peptidoglycan-binding protein)
VLKLLTPLTWAAAQRVILSTFMALYAFRTTECMRYQRLSGRRWRMVTDNATRTLLHIEKPRSAHWWAAYCIKEYGITASRLEAERNRKSRPDYVTQELAQEARAFYEGVSDWLNS